VCSSCFSDLFLVIFYWIQKFSPLKAALTKLYEDFASQIPQEHEVCQRDSNGPSAEPMRNFLDTLVQVLPPADTFPFELKMSAFWIRVACEQCDTEFPKFPAHMISSILFDRMSYVHYSHILKSSNERRSLTLTHKLISQGETI